MRLLGSLGFALVLSWSLTVQVTGYVSRQHARTRMEARKAGILGESSTLFSRVALAAGTTDSVASIKLKSITPPISSQKIVASAALCGLLLTASANCHTALAYSPSDYASETVQAAIGSLQSATGNVEKTFKAYEDIAAIITEGKGVGGDINYKGIQLDRGYISDEDTAIYNPGLTLLTESEKERLVEAVISARAAALQVNSDQWDQDTQLGFEFLRMKLDPFHIVQLRGYLQFVPVVIAASYVGVLAVQQFARNIFPIAYFIGVAAVVGPALALILVGP
jgi:hypothetical protein